MRQHNGRTGKVAMRFGFIAVFAIVASGCVSAQSPSQDNRAAQDRPQVYTPAPARSAPRYTPPAARNAIGPQLEQHIFEKWRSFPGKTGIAVERIDGGGIAGRRLDDMFPQQSVSKLWVALTVLDQVDQGRLRLDQQVTVGYDDFTMFISQVKRRAERQGPVTESVRNLLELSITRSDNTANDKLMWLAGGPQAVRSTLAAKGLNNIRFGPGERELQSSIAGFSWKQEYGPGNNWFSARRKVPSATRRAALNRYLANPVDGATPRAMVDALGRLAREELLSLSSTQMLLGMMERVRSGPKRLKAGVPSYWRFGHKTGTGQNFAGVATGYNDVGIMTAPDGTRYAVAVLLADTTASVPQRMSLMQSISRAVAREHER